jgi:hypothetical protein
MPIDKLMKIFEPFFDKNDPISFFLTVEYITISVDAKFIRLVVKRFRHN